MSSVNNGQAKYRYLADGTKLRVLPQYMGGAKNGKVVPLDGAYHQMITNEFRKKWSYGKGKLEDIQIREIMDAVYKEYPLPPGYSY